MEQLNQQQFNWAINQSFRFDINFITTYLLVQNSIYKLTHMWTLIKQGIEEYPLLSLFILELGFGSLGYYIVTRYLMDKRIKGFLAKSIFTVTFMCSLGLLLMYLYEIFQITIPESIWDFILAILVIMVVIIVPVCLLFKLPYITQSFTFRGYKIPILAIIIMFLYLRGLLSWTSSIKDMKKIQDQIDIFSKRSLNILAEIGVRCGVYIMALLAAYGSVWTPYVYFNNRIDKIQDKLKEAKDKTKDQISFYIEQIKNNKYELLLYREEYEKQARQNKESQPSPSSMLMRGLQSTLGLFRSQQGQSLTALREKISQYQNEIETLNKVHQERFSVYREILEEERKHNISETFIGKFFRLMGYLLSVYSVTKIVLTVWNMFVGRKLSTDPITRLINLISFLTEENVNYSVQLYCQYISFAFMGYLMISNVRSFSINMKNFFDFILRRRKLNILETDTLVLLLSEMYGIYFLTAAILLQSGLPRAYVQNFERITGKVLFIEHFTLFDKLYFWCCILSAVFIAICEYQRIQKMTQIINQRNSVSTVPS